jgi:GNAT superfamily N-acetyltransferase
MSGGSGPRRVCCATEGEAAGVVSAISGKYNPPTMPDYRVRQATLDDIDALARHRIGMFTDMGVALDAPLIDRMFRAWLREMMPSGEYCGWVCESGPAENVENIEIVAGGGITLLKWPPGPSPIRSERIAFVYNVYTEPPHRKQGLARRLMEAIHDWCAQQGVAAVALNAAPAARHLYESMGYVEAPSPMMWKWKV